MKYFKVLSFEVPSVMPRCRIRACSREGEVGGGGRRESKVVIHKAFNIDIHQQVMKYKK